MTQPSWPDKHPDSKPRADGSTATIPSSEIVSLFTTDDYPEEASHKGEQGTVDVTLTVGADGRVADCIVNVSSGSPSLDVQTCRILWTRARFTPARDAQGREVQDTFRQRIRWELLPSDPHEVAEQFSRHIFTVDASSSVINCRYEASSDLQLRNPDCPKLLDNIRQLVSEAPEGVSFSGKEIVVEVQLRVGDPFGGIELGERSGERALSISRTDFTVDDSGKVMSCSRDRWGIVPPHTDNLACDVIQRLVFVELPSDETNRSERKLTFVGALYIRRPPESPE